MKKFFALSLLSLAVLSTSAFADFRPGRVRATAKAEMQVMSADHEFAGVKSAVLFQNTEDGEGFVSLTLKLDNGDSYLLPVQTVNETFCGNFYGTELQSQEDAGSLSANFSDYTNLRCRMYVKNPWHLELTVTNNKGVSSQLKLEGKPEYLMVTM